MHRLHKQLCMYLSIYYVFIYWLAALVCFVNPIFARLTFVQVYCFMVIHEKIQLPFLLQPLEGKLKRKMYVLSVIV